MQYWFSNNYIHKSIQIHIASLLIFFFLKRNKERKEEMFKNNFKGKWRN